MSDAVGEAQTAAFLIALRTKGETVDELAGAGAHDARARRPGGRSAATTCSTPPAPAAEMPTFNVSTTAALRRGRRGLPRRQARQPLRDQPLRLGRPAGGARRAHRPRAGGGRRVHRGGRIRLHVRAAPPRRRRGTSCRCARRSACARSSTSSARSPTPPARRRQLIGVSDPAYLELMAGALVRARVPARAGRIQRGRMDEISVAGETRVRGGDSGRGQRAHGLARARSGSSAREPDARRGGHARARTRRSRGRCSTASPARGARWSLLNAGAALFVGGRASSLEEGVRLAEQTIDSGAALEGDGAIRGEDARAGPGGGVERAR